MKIKEALTFDDVLLVPQYSEVLPTETNVSVLFANKIKLAVPIISSPMDTVTESKMAIAVAKAGGLGVIHKNISSKKQAWEIKLVKKNNHAVAASVGATGDFFERAKDLVKAGVDAIIIDTAHGHSKRVLEAIKKIKKAFPKVVIGAGNVATTDGAKALISAGAEAIRVGIGPGSICTTRVVAGVGVPQMTAIVNCAKVCKAAKVSLIADGGIKYSGDLVRALAAGADMVMLGSLLAGTDEAPGKIMEVNGKKFKAYRGMGSLGAMKHGSRDRYGQESQSVSKLVPEGVEGMLLYKGSAESVVNQLVGGLKSGMGYVGAKNLNELYKKAKFIRITSAGFKESHPHGITITKQAPNYYAR